MPGSFEEYMNINDEKLLSMAAIKKAKGLKECFSCEAMIKVNQYFVTISTLVSNENNVIKINHYTLCKNCSTKIDSNPIFTQKVAKDGK